MILYLPPFQIFHEYWYNFPVCWRQYILTPASDLISDYTSTSYWLPLHYFIDAFDCVNLIDCAIYRFYYLSLHLFHMPRAVTHHLALFSYDGRLRRFWFILHAGIWTDILLIIFASTGRYLMIPSALIGLLTCYAIILSIEPFSHLSLAVASRLMALKPKRLYHISLILSAIFLFL